MVYFRNDIGRFERVAQNVSSADKLGFKVWVTKSDHL
jgi:hypothetical protein